MSTKISTWTRGITGTGIAIGIIVGSSILYPMTSTNLAGHILAWIMAGIIGIKITLSAFEGEENWMEAPKEAKKETIAARVYSSRRTDYVTVNPAAMQPIDRMSWKPTSDIVLEFPSDSARRPRKVAKTQLGFRHPADEEKRECIKFAAENPICSLATLDASDVNRPHVRTVFLWQADESGFYFVLFSSKSVSQQVKAHPHVELCFQNHPTDISEAKQLRINGQMDLLQNRELQEKASHDRNILNTLAGDGNEANIEVYRLSDYKMKFWQMAEVSQKAHAQAVLS